MKHLRAHDGRECPIDIENPLVMIKDRDFGENYQRGSLVYPIAHDKGEKPGSHPSKGWMTISTLNIDTANFCGVEVGKTAVPLRDLLEVSGNKLGVSYNSKGFTRDGKKISGETAINEMLDYYAIMQLPVKVRGANGLSRAISSEPTQYERGIIFEKLENLAAALIVYNTGVTRGSTATRDRLYADMWKEDYLDAGVDDPTIFKTTPKAQLMSLGELMSRVKGSVVERLVSEVMNSGGKYRKSFDYDGMGTSFFKTDVEVEKIDGKYVLGLWAAYVGDKPEIELAKILGKDRGLVRVGSSHQLTPIAQNWIGVDFDKALRGGTLTPDQINVLTRSSVGESKSYEGFVVEMDGMPVKFSLGIGQEKNYKADVSRARGNQIFMRTEGEGKPYFSLSLSPARKDKIVDSEERGKIIKIRDGLSELVRKNLS